jgi:hypothetical protein
MLTMKRKVMRHLGDGEHESKIVLLRDPEDEHYPDLGELNRPLTEDYTGAAGTEMT